MLQEMNNDVNGDYVDESIDHILQVNPEFFKNYDVVVATSLDERSIVTLSNLLWDLNIPLVICRSVGFLGSVRVQVKEHCVIETHPDNRQNDLRLEQPFVTLKEHIDVRNSRAGLSSSTHFALFSEYNSLVEGSVVDHHVQISAAIHSGEQWTSASHVQRQD